MNNKNTFHIQRIFFVFVLALFSSSVSLWAAENLDDNAVLNRRLSAMENQVKEIREKQKEIQIKNVRIQEELKNLGIWINRRR